MNLNDGLSIRNHKDGYRIWMRKSEPGIYYDESDAQVSDDVAAAAGFPVADLAIERTRRERRAEFEKQLEKEMAVRRAELERETAGESIAPPNPKVEEAADKGFVLDHKGGPYYDVISPSGERMNEKSLKRADAEALIAELMAKSAEGDADAESGGGDPE